MAPRVQLEKAAWRWVESVRPEDIQREHIEIAYRICVPACKRGACRRNCKGNPNCLVGIGEHAWLGEIDENTFHNIDDPNSERRDKNTFVGLTNLGATCYVNTFLQVWFHNLELRRTLYLCQNARAEEHNMDSDYEPRSICEHLQYLFALLQNSNRRYIDPSGLVKALGLDTGQQQDAQEFSKLFLSLLEDTLSKQKNPNLQNVIQQQFCGQMSYFTVCNQCGRASPLPSRFYELELNIQGHKNLTECEEKLDGDNRYFCESCQSKQNATRRIKLHSLPRVLNLQLMRFVFDRQTGHKKKLNTFISFPEQLDMGPFLEEKEDEKCVYELSAVLIHRGVSAYSGHYIAHVRDARTSDWYKFNDEEIEKMEGKKLQLGLEEDIAETVKSQTRKPKCSKGYHCSRNAYMLVYKSQGEEDTDPMETNVEVPGFLERLVDRDNRKFEEWCLEMADMRKQSVDKGKAKHEEVKELYELLPAEDEIDNGNFLCSHGKLHPDKVGEAKRISVNAAELLFNKYGGGPRLDGSTLCEECVGQRCRVLRLKNQLAEDYKEVTNLVKGPPKSDEGYWAGKTSLRSWRQLALEQLEEDEEETKHSDGKTNGEGPEITATKEYGPENQDGEEEEMKTFNEDILCRHGGLSILESERRLVTEEVWSKLRVYFPKAPQFTQLQEPCQQCLKSSLLNLFQEKNRPTLTKWPQGDAQHIALLWPDEWEVISRHFLVDQPISICRISEATPNGSNVEYTTQPELCRDCREGFIFQQQRDMREYAQATVYVRKVMDDKRLMKDAAPEMNVSGSEAEDEREEPVAKVDGERDPDFSQSEDGAKRQKLSDGTIGAASSPAPMASGGKSGIRRSTRHRKLRGEKALIIMHAFSVAPFDQNLSIDGRCLTDDSATLGSLGVIPESVICLKADEPIADFAAMDDCVCLKKDLKALGFLATEEDISRCPRSGLKLDNKNKMLELVSINGEKVL
ncbi:unnamed protein product [Coregonus sp. 'balchen']|nr:unnamed protein product [Coregonus sp. 'balchen']